MSYEISYGMIRSVVSI